MGGIGAIAEPLAVFTLLFGGTWINRNSNPGLRRRPGDLRRTSEDDLEGQRDWRSRGTVMLVGSEVDSRSNSPSLLPNQEPEYRARTIGAWGMKRLVITPNTRRFKAYFLSRLLEKFPFLVECWYWALIYWVYQLGRAATAVWIVEGTVMAARKHALQVVAAEEHLHIFWELPIQHFFMKNEFLMTWINRTYSFIHIPGSIAFLVWLFYYMNTRTTSGHGENEKRRTSLRLYEARRRTMALCDLLAFIVFTLWPCMPPRLMSADTTDDLVGDLGRSYGFVDTVHGPLGEGSIWTDNRFTNKFAAMPSLHFGYSLLIGLTIATIPLPSLPTTKRKIMLPFFNQSHPNLAPKITIPTLSKRTVCIIIGALYPSVILVAIIATANHFILDAVAGSVICGIAWWGNDVMLNLLVVEDWFLTVVRIHKPESVEEAEDSEHKRNTQNVKGDFMVRR